MKRDYMYTYVKLRNLMIDDAFGAMQSNLRRIIVIKEHLVSSSGDEESTFKFCMETRCVHASECGSHIGASNVETK